MESDDEDEEELPLLFRCIWCKRCAHYEHCEHFRSGSSTITCLTRPYYSFLLQSVQTAERPTRHDCRRDRGLVSRRRAQPGIQVHGLSNLGHRSRIRESVTSSTSIKFDIKTPPLFYRFLVGGLRMARTQEPGKTSKWTLLKTRRSLRRGSTS
jgi:hypothetical protein